MLIGRQNVLFVCGTDDHGSTSEVAALAAGRPIREFIDDVHARQQRSLERYHIGVDVYSGTSRPDCLPTHIENAHWFLRRLRDHGLLSKRSTQQWYDPTLGRFLPDRLVRGQCPNPKCDNDDAFSDECNRCGKQYAPTELLSPRSTLSDAVPVMRDTTHLFLDMGAVSETLRVWVENKKKTWRPTLWSDMIGYVLPALRFAGEHEAAYKLIKSSLPPHKSKYALGKRVVLQFGNRPDLNRARGILDENGIAAELADDWARRAITRDVSWGIPLPAEFDGELAGKTLYVWPDSLIAPISFSQVALAARGEDPARVAEFWRDPEARICQFLGQDNAFFYVLMQGAMWLGTQDDPHRLPVRGELSLTDIFSCFHLTVGGEKMSKSRGNFVTADELLDERGYDPDQVRYFLALLGLPDKQSNFEFDTLNERNAFLAGPMNAAFERPISAAHSKFSGQVPDGVLLDKVVADTTRMVQRYVKSMERADWPTLLFAIENYARTINSLFTQYKPHDDRHPEESRRNALYSAFYVLKNLMIMLYPFVPTTMERLRESLRLPAGVFRVDELGTPIPAGHAVGPKQVYFPSTEETQT
jgi:methionyl-tRNA synthetase